MYSAGMSSLSYYRRRGTLGDLDLDKVLQATGHKICNSSCFRLSKINILPSLYMFCYWNNHVIEGYNSLTICDIIPNYMQSTGYYFCPNLFLGICVHMAC